MYFSSVHYRIENMTVVTVAARDIHPGEELSVSYVDVFLKSKERKERIREWGFECACALCQAPRNETAAVSFSSSVICLRYTTPYQCGESRITRDVDILKIFNSTRRLSSIKKGHKGQKAT